MIEHDPSKVAGFYAEYGTWTSDDLVEEQLRLHAELEGPPVPIGLALGELMMRRNVVVNIMVKRTEYGRYPDAA